MTVASCDANGEPGEAVALARDRGDEARMAMVILQLDAQAADVAIDDVALDAPMASRISSRVSICPLRLASRYCKLCSMPDRCTTELPARTGRFRMSTSISPRVMVGHDRPTDARGAAGMSGAPGGTESQLESRSGGVAEWTIAAVLKTAVGKPTVGSNPTPSAIYGWFATPPAPAPRGGAGSGPRRSRRPSRR